MRRVVVIARASGSGKTTFARELGRRLDVPVVEVDSLVHGPCWVETPLDELREAVEALVASDSWVIDGSYFPKIGDLVLPAADAVVWLDLPIRIWVPRLFLRTLRRLRRRELLWNGNRETFRSAFWGRESLFAWAIGAHFRRRREWPEELRDYPLVHLRTVRSVRAFLERPAP